MKAVVMHRYGGPDVLDVQEVDKPTVGDDDVLVRVRAASVNPADWRPMRGRPYFIRLMLGLRRPKDARVGIDVAGQVEAVGRNVTQFRPGDEVFGAKRGAMAEYVCAREKALVPKPANVSFEAAAAVPVAGLTALQGLRDKGQLQAGQKVLINGAAGGVGTFAVQIAKAFGAHVTGVCSGRNVEMVRSLGADRVIDYTREDFLKSGERYDLILDNVGNRPLWSCRRVMTPTGTFVVVGGPDGGWIAPFAPFIQALVLSRFVKQRMIGFISNSNKEDLTTLGDLLETGKMRSVIDRCYPLAEVREAVRYVETKHARAKVVIVVSQDAQA